MWSLEDMETDALPEDLVAEFVREKLLPTFDQEVPHSAVVVSDSYEGGNRWSLPYPFRHHFG